MKFFFVIMLLAVIPMSAMPGKKDNYSIGTSSNATTQPMSMKDIENCFSPKKPWFSVIFNLLIPRKFSTSGDENMIDESIIEGSSDQTQKSTAAKPCDQGTSSSD